MKNINPKEGDRVIVRGNFGRGSPEVVTVEEIDEKNGLPLICYTDSKGHGRWAYFDQIVRVIK